MAVISVGTAAIDGDGTGTNGYTFLSIGNPANLSGTITSIEIWANTNLTGCKVGTFYLITGRTYKCRATVTIGAVTAGSKQTFSELSLAIEAGDLIGCYHASGKSDMSLTGDGIYYISGDKVVAENQSSYTLIADRASSLYGTGSTEEAEGWVGKVIGVTNPAKVLGIAVADIAKVNGVS